MIIKRKPIPAAGWMLPASQGIGFYFGIELYKKYIIKNISVTENTGG